MNETLIATGRESALELNLLAQTFLAREAKMLDERRFWDWFATLDEDIIYHVPNRQVTLAYAEETPSTSFRIRDTLKHIETRIKRLDTGAAWAETPPSRTTRLVGSLLVERTDRSDVIAVESALFLYRQRGTDNIGDVIPVRRQDLLRLTEGGVRLLRRTALLPEVSLSTCNLGVFL